MEMQKERKSLEETKLLESYAFHKKKVRDWEKAIEKSTGAPSKREDLVKAPSNVRESYRRYREIKRQLEGLQNSNHDSKNEVPVSTPPKFFRTFSMRTRSSMVLQSDTETESEKTPVKKTIGSTSTTIPSTRKSERRPNLYKTLSNRLFAKSNEPLAVQRVPSPSKSENSEEKSKETVDADGVDPEPSAVFNFTTMKLRNSLGNNRSNTKPKERTSDVSAISQFFVADVDGSSPKRIKNSSHLRQVDKNWLQRCDQELMDTSGNDKNILEPEPALCLPQLPLPETVVADEIAPEALIAEKLAPESMEMDTNFDNDLGIELLGINYLISTIDSAILSGNKNESTPINSEEKENNAAHVAGVYSTTLKQKPDDFYADDGDGDSGLILSMDAIREIVDEVSKSHPSQNNSELEPTFLDPYAFEPAVLMTPQKKTPRKILTITPRPPSTRKRTISSLLAESPEKISSEPKRKFFKSRRLPMEPLLRGNFGPDFPKTKKQMPKRPGGNRNTRTRSGQQNEGTSTAAVAESSVRVRIKSTPESKRKKKTRTIPNSFPVRRKSSLESKSKSKTLEKKSNMKKAGDGETGGPPTGDSGQHVESDIFDQVASGSKKGTERKVKGKGRFKRPKMTDKEYLEMKVKTGRVNENFVRIDVSRKVFVRGRKRMTGIKMKKLEWKANHAATSKLKLAKCNKCGDVGHFAKFCIQDMSSKDTQPESTEESPFPTLQEAARMIFSKTSSIPSNRVSVYETDKPLLDQNPASSMQLVLYNSSSQDHPDVTIQSESQFEKPAEVSINSELSPVQPLFTEEPNDAHETETLLNCLQKFGYQDFRPGQQEAILRTLKGLSTLVILSTGSGKSLCYQLPAYLYSQAHPGCITLCVSPLVSLMEDQIVAMPPFLHAACLHTMMTATQKENVLEKVRKKKLQILIVSPEAVCSGLFGLLRDVDTFPPVAFACIDEVHCVSEWSHNFRPSYLKLCKILRDKLKVHTILGLTATATNRTSSSICSQLYIDQSTVIRGEIIPMNLNLSVSRDQDRDVALIYLLSEGRFKTCESIIIYCTRREECERISVMLRVKFQTLFGGIDEVNRRQRISTSCEAYHAGMSGSRRRLVQNKFMSGHIRIVVATVAFGMGIDKSDIRAVIHYNMPKTFESYVQEIGRAGRDGLPAHCHLFLDNVRGRDLSELKRHVYANSVDRATVRKLISKVFRPCKCARIESLKSGKRGVGVTMPCTGHEISFSVAQASIELDLPEENIETLFCYLELDTSRKWIEMLPKCYQMCKIQSYGGSRLLKSAAQKCPAIAVAIAVQKEKRKFKEDDIYLEFNLVDVAATVGWSSSVVRRELKRLEWTGTEFDENGHPTKFRKSGLIVEFSDLAHRLISPGDLSDDECDRVLELLHGRNLEQERTQLYQLHRVHQALLNVSTPSVMDEGSEFSDEKCEKLKKFIYEYFHQSTSDVPSGWNLVSKPSEREEDIRQDTRKILLNYQNIQFTGRAIARIFQGISSPNFPSDQWYRNRAFWRRYLDVDFNFLNKITSEEVIAFQ